MNATDFPNIQKKPFPGIGFSITTQTIPHNEKARNMVYHDKRAYTLRINYYKNYLIPVSGTYKRIFLFYNVSLSLISKFYFFSSFSNKRAIKPI